MKGKFCLFICCIFNLVVIQAQNSEKADLEEIKVNKFQKVSKFISWDHTMSSVGKDFDRVLFRIKFDFDSKKDDNFDLNKFSLVDHTNKLRFRIVDASYNNILGAYVPALKLAKNSKARQSLPYIRYDQTVPDTFYDFNINGYENIEFMVQIAGRKKNITLVYMKPVPRKSLKKAKLYFGVPKAHNDSEYLLYYGKEIVGSYTY